MITRRMIFVQLTDYDFTLPDQLIARYPAAERSASRLLHCNRSKQTLSHQQFSDIASLLQPGDLLVLNDTKVMQARLFGQKDSGGNVEILLERLLSANEALVQIRASKSAKIGQVIYLSEHCQLHVLAKFEWFYRVRLRAENQSFEQVLETLGEIPIPPYFARRAEAIDKERYQTIYSEQLGSVAAPTAGLHFDETTFQQLAQRDIDTAFITLHVGAGTFQPLRHDCIEANVLHNESIIVDSIVCQKVMAAKARGSRVIAVGTTTARSLESTMDNGQLQPFIGETSLFIFPGYDFKCIDGLLTNFHLPKSSLLLLVAAFAGYDFMKEAYQTAIAEHYRFYSYGDAMLIT